MTNPIPICLWLRSLASSRRLLGPRAATSLALVIFVLVAAASCAKSPTRPVYVVKPVPTVDPEAAWSNDDQWIAFRRGWWSSYGPPGIYIISAAGGTPRFLMRGDFFFPRFLSFSPDDRYIIADAGFEIAIIDVATGENGLLFYAQDGASYPDWSPDGHSVIYFRYRVPMAPLDSSGVRVFDLATRSDRRVLVGGRPVMAWFPMLELTRFRGHLTFGVGGFHDAEEEARTTRAVPG